MQKVIFLPSRYYLKVESEVDAKDALALHADDRDKRSTTMTSTVQHHKAAIEKAPREWLKYPLAIGEPLIFAPAGGSAGWASSIESVDVNEAVRRPKLIRSWREGRSRIAMGLFCSALTCVASVTINALLDAGDRGFLSIAYLKHLAVGYFAAAAVVVTIFPLLPALLRWAARYERPGSGSRR
jgi:hypothetical protein